MPRMVAVCAAVLAVAGAVSAQAPATQPRPDPRKIELRGDRFKPLTWDEMTPAQRTMVEHLFAGPRAGANGPFNVLLRSPEMGDIAQQFGASMRFNPSMPPRLNELAIIITARYWTSQYEWYAHHRLALKAGLAASVAGDLAQGRRPAGMQEDEAIVYDFCRQLHNQHEVSDATFKAAVERFGEQGVVDLIAVNGYYSLVSMILNVDRTPAPGGAKPLPPLK